MNRLRGQKKDATRVLRAMKTDEIAFDNDIHSQNKSKDLRKNRELVALYTSNSKKPEPAKNTRRNYRYDRNPTEQEPGLYAITRKQNSLELKSSKMFRVSSKSQEKQSLLFRNPYVTRNSTSSYVSPMPNPLKRYPNKRRLLTHEAPRHQTSEKIIHVILGKNSQEYEKVEHMLEEARDHYANSKFSESQSIVQSILKTDPDNLDALFLSGANNLGLMNYVKSLAALNKLAELNPLYKETIYIMASTCYHQMGKSEEAIKRISAGLNYFPDSADIIMQKGSLFMKMGLFQQALPFLKKCLPLSKDIYQPLLKLAECYENMRSFKLAIKIYDQMACLPNLSTKGYKCYLKKAKCLKKLGKYKEYITAMETYMKLSPESEVMNQAEIYYGVSYAYYKLKEYPNAIMSIEDIFKEKDKQYSTKGLILLTVIYMMERNFYEASHCLSRKEHLQIQESQLAFYQNFCEGVINLMKRKFLQGLKNLETLQFSQDSHTVELQRQLAIMHPLYLSYAYFCEGNMKRCLEEIDKILESQEPCLQRFKAGASFNKMLCEGLEYYRKGNTRRAVSKFSESIKIYPNKPEGYLYLGLCQIQLYVKNGDRDLLDECNRNLDYCLANLKELNNNYAASAYYCKSAVSAYLENWDDAMHEIDEAIQRSQENQSKMFFQRAQILGCCQNYKQAIHEATVAISLNQDEPSYYLLRSKCYQIQGEGNKAFADLQNYINLSPEDSNIHKYAGHLLFENGAFQDALQAYQNGTVQKTAENIDVFLTKSKTHFLLGNLDECISDMELAFSFRKNDHGIKFDISVLKLLRVFFNSYQGNGIDLSAAKEKLFEMEDLGGSTKFERIFRKTQIKVLEALFTFYQGDYRTAGRFFHEAVKLKQEGFMQTTEEEFEEEEKEKHFFISQMHYNRAVCHLVMLERIAAVTCLKKCHIDPSSKTQQKLVELIKLIQNQGPKKQQKPVIVSEVFTQKNKLTRNLQQTRAELPDKIIQLKLSIPFPKVEPPEINPKYDSTILKSLNPKLIQRKPQAPWILREDNSIKFTEKIEKFSRLDINNSEMSKNSNSKRQLGQPIEKSQEDSESIRSLTDLKAKLMLDGEVEEKLKRIMQRR